METGIEETFIIDGYNLLRRVFTFREGENLQGARERLEIRLREYRRTLGTGVRIILIYDGAGEIPLSAGIRPDEGFQVVFSLPPTTADDAVIETCRRLDGSGRLTVVTSDIKDIVRNVRGLRVRHRTSEQFADMMDDAMERSPAPGTWREPEKARAEEKPMAEEMPAAEAEQWLRIFSEPKEPKRPKEPKVDPDRHRGRSRP
jgi:predicted RNA-binding protein with PIN domain